MLSYERVTLLWSSWRCLTRGLHSIGLVVSVVLPEGYTVLELLVLSLLEG